MQSVVFGKIQSCFQRVAKSLFLPLSLALGLWGGLVPSAQAQIEIQWWHAMGAALGERVVDLANRFNAEQKEYKIVPTFKGSYPETLSAGIAAYRAKTSPHILQVFEVGTATMMSAKGAIKPAYEVMKIGGRNWDPSGYIPAVAGYYTDREGRMLSMPFNSSTPVFYYNRDAFKKAGISKVPETWKEMEGAVQRLKDAGFACPYTTGWVSWVHLENMSAWHNIPFASDRNGFDSPNPKLLLNGEFQVKHIEMLARWVKNGWFMYGGRTNESEPKFFNGECVMLTSSSGAQANIRKNAKFDFGVSALPYHDTVKGAPVNTIIGGASLWTMAGKTDKEYIGVARFFDFLSRPEIQAEWHQQTGYLPITSQVYDRTMKSGYYDKNPGTDVSVRTIWGKVQTNTRGVRVGNFVQIRDIIAEELEGVWKGDQTAKQALDKSVQRGNDQIAKFHQANKS